MKTAQLTKLTLALLQNAPIVYVILGAYFDFSHLH